MAANGNVYSTDHKSAALAHLLYERENLDASFECFEQSLINNVKPFVVNDERLIHLKKYHPLGPSPGLVVMGDDTCLRGHGFQSQCCILDGHVIFCMDLLSKLYCFVLKDQK